MKRSNSIFRCFYWWRLAFEPGTTASNGRIALALETRLALKIDAISLEGDKL